MFLEHGTQLTLRALPLASPAAGLCRRHVRHPAQHLVRSRLVIRHRTGEFPPGRAVQLITVVAEVLEPFPILLGEHLLRQRFKVLEFSRGDAALLSYSISVIVVHEEAVP